MTRSGFLMAVAGLAPAVAAERPKMRVFERQELDIAGFEASGYVLDVGGGGEGIIGRMKPRQVVAIDLFKRELQESPPGPLKIVMDATDLKFLDETFDTATAFFSLMYMKPDVQRKVFAEVRRVLTPGGRWLVWDAIIPTAPDAETKGPIFRFTFKLPGETVNTGYGTFWPDKPLDIDYYRRLASESGFSVAGLRRTEGEFQTFFMELRKA